MSATPLDTFPDDLTSSAWEKDKKSGFDAKSDLADKLKALQKKHGATEWKQFDDGWAKAAETLAELDDAFALRDRVYRSSVFALKKDALAVASLAKTEEKKATKPLLDTLKAIGKAANTYADEIDKGLDALKRTFDKAKDNMPDDQDDEDSLPAALVNPKLLYKQLTLCRNDPERAMRFAFVDAKDKEQPALLALHPRMSGRSLFKKLQDAAGVKTGAHGSAWIDGANLMLQLDKPLSGLVKKVRAPVKASGFKVAKVILWNADGTVFEQDEDGEGDAATGMAVPASGGATSAPSTPPASADYEARLARVQSLVDQATAVQHPASAKLPPLMRFATTKAAAGDYAGAIQGLDAVEKMLAAAPRSIGAKVAFTQARLAWEQTRKHVQAELQKLQQTLLAECMDEPDFADITQNSGIVFTVLSELDKHDQALIDKLDEALNAPTTEARQDMQRQAAALIDAYRAYVQTDTLVRDVQDNGFESVSIVGPVTERLNLMAAQLKAVAAL